MDILKSSRNLSDLINTWSSDMAEISVFNEMAKNIILSLEAGRKVIFFGNGGSAAEASHLAGEFLGKCEIDVGPYPAISLSDSSTLLTAISNDWEFNEIFSRQIRGLGVKGDFAIGLTTSGKSQNILSGLKTAKKMGIQTALWTSELFENDSSYIDYLIKAPSKRTPRIQELHLFIGHALCEEIENTFFKKQNFKD